MTPSSFLSKHFGPILFGAVTVVLISIGIITSLYKEGAPSGPAESPAISGESPRTQKIGAESILRVQFTTPMDTKNTDDVVELSEGLKGNVQWDDMELTVTPSRTMVLGEHHTVTVKAGAKRKDGTPLLQDQVYTFEVAGPPTLATKFPRSEQTDVPATDRITMIFDRPMVPLAAVHAKEGIDAYKNFPATISPALEGRWRWLSTTAVEFASEDGLLPATAYRINVPAGITAISGEKTAQDLSWEFETLRPMLVSHELVPAASQAGPKSQIALQFNQDVDKESVLQSLMLGIVAKDGPKTGGILNATIPVHVAYGRKEVDGKTVEDRSVILVRSQSALPLDSTLELTVRGGARAARGDLGSVIDATRTIETAGPLTVTGGMEWGAINLHFSSPLPTEDFDLKKYVTMDPPPSDWETLMVEADMWSDYQSSSFYPVLEPSTAYTVTVKAGLPDAYGQTLAQPFTFSFTTDPLEPYLTIESKGDEFGIFERSKPPVYRIKSVNVTDTTVEIAKLTMNEFLDIRRDRKWNWTEPDLKAFSGYKSWTVSLKGEENEWMGMDFSIEEKMGSSLDSGVYAMVIHAPEYRNTWDGGKLIKTYQFFTLTRTGLALKYSGNEALVFATDLETGASVAGANVTVLNLDGKRVTTGTTDAQGIFRTKIDMRELSNQDDWEPEFWVTAEKGGDFAFVGSTWMSGIRPYDFSMMDGFRTNGSEPADLQMMLRTDRPLYRAGDTVHFSGIARLLNANGDTVLPNQGSSVVFNVTDANGSEVWNTTVPVTPFGGFSAEMPVAPDASLGDYWVNAHLTPEAGVGMNYTTHTFPVLAYRKPEYRVELTPEKEGYTAGDTVTVAINGSYYFGAPMNGAAVMWRAVTLDYFFNKVTDEWYSFGPEETWCYWDCSAETSTIAEGEGTLDERGNLLIRVPADLAEKDVSQILTVEADITDPNNQVVSSRVSVPVHLANAYVGIRTEDYVVEPQSEATISVLSIKPDGSPIPSATITLELSSREWNTVRTKGVDGEYYYESTPKDTFIKRVTVRTDENGKGRMALEIPSGGQFVIKARINDGGGREAVATTSIYAWSSTYVNWPRANSDRMDIIADKPEYSVGDTAKLLVKSPFQGQGVKALVTVEREGIRTVRVIDITSTAQSIEVPITEDLIPNAYVSVVVQKPRIGETFDEDNKDTGVPAFRVGYVKLPIETDRKTLTVTVETDKERYAPGDEMTVTLKTMKSDGTPAQAEIALSVVDRSILDLAGFTMPSPVAFFYGERGLGVRTAMMLSYLIDRYKPGSKGGGGADGDERARGTFKDTAYWNPAILTNANGEATVRFTLPDNLTTWHLLAVAHTKENMFGAQAETVVETKDVLVRSVRPRFAVQGDRMDIGAIVHNETTASAEFTVSLGGSGFTLDATKSQTVTIEPGTQKKLLFPVTVQNVSALTLRMHAQSTAGNDLLIETIPVYAFTAPQSVATSGITETSVTEMLVSPTDAEATGVMLEARVSPTIASLLPGGLAYLSQYPYGCAEQTTSALLPSIVLSRLSGLDALQEDPKNLQTNVSAGLARIALFQRSDGGFGFFEESHKSNPYISAYILFAMHEAKQAGFTVDGTMISRVQQYLDGVLKNQALEKKMDIVTRTYILYVLAETGAPDVTRLNAMAERMSELPLFAKAQLALALDSAGADAKARTALSELLEEAVVDGRGAHFREAQNYREYLSTDTRSTAFGLLALLRLDPDHVLVPQMVRHLLAVREDGHWDTTQSTVMSLLAFIEYLEQTKELDADMTATIALDAKNVLSQRFTKANILEDAVVTLDRSVLPAGEHTVTVGKEGTGRVYYDLVLSYLWKGGTLPPAEEGMSITRTMEPVTEGDDMTTGTIHKVTLTMTLPEERHFVAVESPLPAGLEPIDFRFQTSQQVLLGYVTEEGGEEVGSDDPSWWWYESPFEHVELRDDRVFLFAEHLEPGVYRYEYLVRATTPGTFLERPARVWEMYFPEVFGQTSGGPFTVKGE